MATEPSDWPNRGKGAQTSNVVNRDAEFKTTKANIVEKPRTDWEKKREAKK